MKKSILRKTLVLSTAATLTLMTTTAIAADDSMTGENQPTATSDTDRANNYDTVSTPRWKRNTTRTERSTTSSRAMRPVPSSGETVVDPGSEGTPQRGTGEMINRGPGTFGTPANGTTPGTNY